MNTELAIFLIYLFYGAVFFAIGVAITSRHKTISKLRIASTFWFFALFAFFHAFHEWLELFLEMSREENSSVLLLVQNVNLLLVFSSFLFLLLFGINLLQSIKPGIRLLLWGLGLLLLLSSLLLLLIHLPLNRRELIGFIDYNIRKIIGFPATMIAGVAFYYYARFLQTLSKKGAGNFMGASMALFVYGGFTGLIPSTTQIIYGVPVELFRGSAAFIILHFIMYGLDVFVTEREENIMERLKSNARTERLSSLGRMAAGIAHEINNPLANVSLQLEMLTSEITAGELPAKTMNRLAVIKKSIARSATIARELLLFASDQDVDHVFEPCRLVEIINSAWQVTSPKSDAYHLAVMPEDSKNTTVQGVRLKLEELFVNLFLNAMDAMDVGGTVFVSIMVDEGSTLVTIRDQGRGITPEKIAMVMEPFFTTKETGQGTGLGLSICHSIMETHGGSIDFRSDPGKGSTVTLSFPTGGPRHV